MTKLAFHFMFEIVVRWAGKLVRVGEIGLCHATCIENCDIVTFLRDSFGPIVE